MRRGVFLILAGGFLYITVNIWGFEMKSFKEWLSGRHSYLLNVGYRDNFLKNESEVPQAGESSGKPAKL
jgi:hypothetical protein